MNYVVFVIFFLDVAFMWVLFSVVLSYLTEAKWDTYNIAWAPTGMDKGAFALSWKS